MMFDFTVDDLYTGKYTKDDQVRFNTLKKLEATKPELLEERHKLELEYFRYWYDLEDAELIITPLHRTLRVKADHDTLSPEECDLLDEYNIPLELRDKARDKANDDKRIEDAKKDIELKQSTKRTIDIAIIIITILLSIFATPIVAFTFYVFFRFKDIVKFVIKTINDATEELKQNK